MLVKRKWRQRPGAEAEHRDDEADAVVGDEWSPQGSLLLFGLDYRCAVAAPEGSEIERGIGQRTEGRDAIGAIDLQPPGAGDNADEAMFEAALEQERERMAGAAVGEDDDRTHLTDDA